jgi:hypothetical protein
MTPPSLATPLFASLLIAALGGRACAISWTSFDHPDGFQIFPQDISDGKIVGFMRDSSFNFRGFLYDGATWTTLNYPGATRTLAYGIDGNRIVGEYDGDYAFLYDGTTWTTLEYPNSILTNAHGIDGNNIIGKYVASGVQAAFRFDGTNWTSFQYPGIGGPDQGTVPRDIDGNNIVGFYSDGFRYYGFLYNGTSWTTLQHPDGNWTELNGIDGDNIVGTSEITSSFLYDGTNWTPLDYPAPEFAFTQVEGIDDNRIVGWYQDSMGQHGFLAVLDTISGDYNNDGAVDAADYVVWRKTNGATADYNQWRTSFGQTSGSSATATSPSATIPEPTTAVLLALAAALRIERRR